MSPLLLMPSPALAKSPLGAQVVDTGSSGPQECMKGGVADEIRGADNRAFVVDFLRLYCRSRQGSTQILPFDRLPSFRIELVARQDVDSSLLPG